MTTYKPEHPIAGATLGTAAAWIAYLRKSGVNDPEAERYLEEVYTLAPAAGLGAHKIVAQFLHETAGATSEAWKGSRNPAGIGVTSDAMRHWHDFKTGQNAARAHVYHVGLYVLETIPPALSIHRSTDPRAGAVGSSIRGKKKTLGSFGGSTPEAPTWAVDPDYGQKWADWLNKTAPVFTAGETPAEVPPVSVAAFQAIPVQKSFIPAGNPNYPSALLNADDPLWITVHETGNTRVGADAEMHARFLWQGGGTSNVAFHFAVDRFGAWQMLKLNRIGWHASDGCDNRNTDIGCFASIAIETCVDNNNAYKAETRTNLLRLIAMILTGHPSIDFGGVDYRRFSASRIAPHKKWAYDSKECPTYMLRDGYMPRIPALVSPLLSGSVVGLPVAGLVPGDRVRTTDVLNLRTGFGVGFPVVKTLPAGTEGTVITDDVGAYTRSADGYTWINVSTSGTTGWAAADWLEEIAAPAPPPVVTPAPVFMPAIDIPELDKVARGAEIDVNTIPAAIRFTAEGAEYMGVWVGDRVKATAATPRQVHLEAHADRRGAELKVGEEFDVDWLILKPGQADYKPRYRTPWGTIIDAGAVTRVSEIRKDF